MTRIYPAKRYGGLTPKDLGATYWLSQINPDYCYQDKTVIGGIATDSVSYLTNRGSAGSTYDCFQPYKNLQPDLISNGLNGLPGIQFDAATSDGCLLSWNTGLDIINNVAGITVGMVLSLPTFTSSQRIMRFNNNANNLSRLEILAITSNRIQVGGTRLNTDTVTSTATATNAYTANTPFVFIAQLNFAGNTLAAWLNGTQVINNTAWLNGTGAGTNTAAENANTAQLGYTTHQANWLMGEPVGFKHSSSSNILSAADIGRLTTYLKKGALIA